MRGCILLFAICAHFSPVAIGGEIMDRIKKLCVESACFEFPSMLYFDISIIQDNKDKDMLNLKRYLGRYVKGRGNEFRVDFLRLGDPAGGREDEFQHGVCYSDGQKEFAKRSASTGFNSAKVDRSQNMPIYLARCNPFRCTMHGASEFAIRTHPDYFKEIIDNAIDYEKEPNTIRNVTRPWKMTLEFVEGRADDWLVSNAKVYFPARGPEYTKMLMNKGKGRVEDVRKWRLLRETNVEWKEVDGIGPIPCWILDREEGAFFNDPSECQDTEMFFFGFQFDNLPLATLFDQSRFTREAIQEDFNIEVVRKMAEKARAEIAAARMQARKK
jgi:hypothetical protein